MQAHVDLSGNRGQKSSARKSLSPSAMGNENQSDLNRVKFQDQQSEQPDKSYDLANFQSNSQAPRDNTMISQQRSTLGSVSNVQDQTASIRRYAVGSTQLQMPVTDYYHNKYGQGTSPKNFDETVQDPSTENQFML